MTAGPLLWPIVVGLIVILLAPALLFATTLLERMIAVPEPERLLLREQKANVRINGKER